jgi:signal transduction histidine kinase
VGDNVHFLADVFRDLLSLLDVYADLRAAAGNGDGAAALLQRLAAAEAQVDLPYLQEEIPAAIAQTKEGIERIATIVGAMRTFAHPASGVKNPADLNQALQTTLTVARNEYKYVADVVTDFEPDLPLVTCDLGDLNQVFLNLLVNAAHAIREQTERKGGGRGTISVGTRQVEGEVLVTITDTGAGIPPAIRSRIFDPFFTTKPVGQGTGQGLAIAHAIVVKKHGGRLTFESAVGQGTAFTVVLPLNGTDSQKA